MELASGRSVKESGSSRGGGGGSESGRGTSGRDRERDFDYKSKNRDREYGRAGRADRDRKDYGGGGSAEGQQRWRGTMADSRGGSRHYMDSREKAYRYQGHRDRSRSPPPGDRNKRPRVASSPGVDARGVTGSSSNSSSSNRRDGRNRDRPRSRDADRDQRSNDLAGSGGSGRADGYRSSSRGGSGDRGTGGGVSGGHSGSSSSGGGGGRRLADLPEELLSNGGGRSGKSGSGGGGALSSSSSGRKYHDDDDAAAAAAATNASASAARLGKDFVRRKSSSSRNGGGAGGGGHSPGGDDVDDKGRTPGTGDSSGGAGGGSGSRGEGGADGGEEGEVLLSPVGRGGRRDDGVGRDVGRDDDDYREEGESSAEGGARSDASPPPSRRGSPEIDAAAIGAGDDEGGPVGGGGGDLRLPPLEEPPRRGVAKDRWADSDSEDDEDDAGGSGKKATSRGAADSGKSNGAATDSAGPDASRSQDATAKRSGEGGVGPTSGDGRDREDVGQGAEDVASSGAAVTGAAAGAGSGAAGTASGTGAAAAPALGADELHQAMAGTAGKRGGEKSPRVGDGESGDDVKSSAGAGGGGDGALSSRPGMRASRPLNVYTRGDAMPDTYNPLLYGCRSVDNYERITFIDEGAYGKVYCALNKGTGQVVALKQVKLTRDNGKEGFPITALRETNVLLSLHNPNIVRVLEMVVGSTLDKVYMVMEYFDHDLKTVMRHLRDEKRCFSLGQVKSLVLQLLSAVEYMHRHWYIHRDLKTSNLLYNHQGKLAVCDFGLARKYEDPIRPYTSNVVTQWYRCPELLLGEKTYSTGVDTWSVGCIFGELVKGSPMFQGKSEIDQLAKIFGVLGSPTEDRWPGWSKLPLAKKLAWRQGPENQLRATFPTTGFSGQASISNQGLDLMNGLLALDPAQRTSAAVALEHWWFTTERPQPTPVGEMPQVDSKLDKPINDALAKWSKAQIGRQSQRGGFGFQRRLA